MNDTALTSVLVELTTETGKDAQAVKIVQKAPDAPVASDVSVTPLDENNRAKLIVDGENLSNATVEVQGVKAAVTNVESSENSLVADLEFSIFYSARENSLRSLLINSAIAQELQKGVCVIKNDKGEITVPCNANPPTSIPPGTNLATFQMSFNLTNPLKGSGENPTFGGLVGTIASFIFNLAVPVAVIIIVYGGFRMLTSGGKPAQYQKGLAALKYASLGLAVMIIAKGFVTLIQSVLSVK